MICGRCLLNYAFFLQGLQSIEEAERAHQEHITEEVRRVLLVGTTSEYTVNGKGDSTQGA